MPIYLKIEKVEGESRIAGNEKEIEVSSFQFGAGAGIDTTSAGWAAGRVSMSEITFTKNLDNSSTILLQKICAGTHYEKATFTFTKHGTDAAGANEAYLTVLLEHCFVSGFSLSSGGDRPSESVSFAFKKINVKYGTQGKDGSVTATAPEFAWDLEANKG